MVVVSWHVGQSVCRSLSLLLVVGIVVVGFVAVVVVVKGRELVKEGGQSAT